MNPMPASPVLSGKGVNCPYCRAPRFWTDSPEDYERLKKETAGGKSPLELDVGVDVGRWSDRKDIAVNKVYPMLCGGCQRVFVARLGILNAEEIRKKTEFLTFNPPTASEAAAGVGIPRERWGYIGYSISDFAEMVRSIKNDFLREAVLRKLDAAGWRLMPLAGP